MNNRFIVQLIVVITSILLGMFLYPWLRRKFVRFIETIYMQTRDDKPIEERKEPTIKDEMPSIVGKSKFNPGHSRTKAATDLESEKAIEKVSTFVPPTDSDPQIKDVEVPLEKVDNLPEEEFDEEAEQEELEIGRDAYQASGVSFDELAITGKIITKHQPTDEEKDKAGRVLYENKNTQLLEQIMSRSPQVSNAIASIIDFHLAKRNSENENRINRDFPQELKDFDINSVF